MSCSEEKAALRKSAREMLKTLDAEEKRRQSAAVCQRLRQMPELLGAKVVLAYAAMKNECSPAEICRFLSLNGCTVAYPLCGQNGSFEAYAPYGDMKPGLYGIFEPDPAASLRILPEEIDAVLVPGMCFDAGGGRLGKGGGYYDRYLPRTHAVRIGIAFDCQMVAGVPREPFDEGVDAVVTAGGLFVKKF